MRPASDLALTPEPVSRFGIGAPALDAGHGVGDVNLVRLPTRRAADRVDPAGFARGICRLPGPGLGSARPHAWPATRSSVVSEFQHLQRSHVVLPFQSPCCQTFPQPSGLPSTRLEVRQTQVRCGGSDLSTPSRHHCSTTTHGVGPYHRVIVATASSSVGDAHKSGRMARLSPSTAVKPCWMRSFVSTGDGIKSGHYRPKPRHAEEPRGKTSGEVGLRPGRASPCCQQRAAHARPPWCLSDGASNAPRRGQRVRPRPLELIAIRAEDSANPSVPAADREARKRENPRHVAWGFIVSKGGLEPPRDFSH